MKGAWLALLLTFASYAQANQDWPEVMDQIFVPPLEAGIYAGSSVVIVQNKEVVFVRGYGRADADGNPFTESTRSYLGSVSKSFTALAIVMLAAQDKLELDAPVQNYLSDFKLANDASSITVRQLLQHTSGLDRYTGNRNQTDQNQDPQGLKDVVDELANWEIATTPGTHFDYSNANYQVLGRLIEVVSGQSYADTMSSLVFQPLGMIDTQVGHNFKHPNAADGYRFWGTSLIPHQQPMGAGLMPQGGVSTTANDMGRYLIALMGGNEDVPNVWDEELAKGHDLAKTENYAAGWTVDRHGEELLLVHHGLNGGFTAATALLPHAGTGIAVITNTGDGFLTGDLTLFQNQALKAVISSLPAEPIDFTPRYIQFVGICALIFALISWIVMARRRGIKTDRFVLRLTVPTVMLLACAYGIGVVLPHAFGIPLSGIGVFYPDVGLLLTLCAGLSLVWGGVRLVMLTITKIQSEKIQSENVQSE